MTVTQINKKYKQNKGQLSVITNKDYVPSRWPTGVYGAERDSLTLQNDRWESHYSSDVIHQPSINQGPDLGLTISDFLSNKDELPLLTVT